MKRSISRHFSFFALLAVVLSALALPAYGQTPAEFESVAAKAADRIAKSRQEHIFIAGLMGCQLDSELCGSLETSLRRDIANKVPGAHFVNRQGVINILEGRGFLAIDAYVADVLQAVTRSAGADILVTENLTWQSDAYGLFIEIYDVARQKKLDEFRSRIPRSGSNAAGETFILTDPASHASAIVLSGKESGASLVTYPACDRCPDPQYTQQARSDRIQGRVLLMATINEQGMAEQVGVVDGLADGLTDQALEAVHSWRFKPAIGKDGKPFAARIPVEVTFRLQ